MGTQIPDLPSKAALALGLVDLLEDQHRRCSQYCRYRRNQASKGSQPTPFSAYCYLRQRPENLAVYHSGGASGLT